MAGVRRIYGATGLTGGATGSLDNIDSTILKAGDLAIAQANTIGGPGHDTEFDGIYFYRYAAVTPVPSEDSPKVIKPDNLSDIEPGRWLLISPAYFMEDLTIEAGQKVIVNDIESNTTDLKLSYFSGTVATIGDVTLTSTGTLADGTYTNGGAGYATTTDGSGVGATVDVVISGSGLYVSFTLNDAGSGYEAGDTLVVAESLDFSDQATGSLDATVATKSAVYITIGDNLVTIDAPVIFNEQVTSTVLTGTAPLVIDSTTQVDNLNVEYHGGEPITNISLLDDNTYKYSVLPQVTDATTVVPTVNADLVTKKWVDDQLAGAAGIDHDTLDKLVYSDEPTNTVIADDHTQYIRVDCTRAFTTASSYPRITTYSGNPPTSDNHLAPKGYVDGLVNPIATTYVKRDGTTSFTGIQTGVTPTYGAANATDLVTVNYVGTAIANADHSVLQGLGDDDHTQYILASGTRAFVGTVSGITPTLNAHLTTKLYVDTEITGITDVYIVKDGSIAFTQPAQVVITPAGALTGIVAGSGGYTTAGSPYATTGGSGTGLTVNIVDNGSGGVASATVATPGSGYTADDVVTIVGGGNNATGVIDGNAGITPSEPYHYATVAYVSSVISGGAILHDDLASRDLDNNHLQYALVGSIARPFTAKVQGVTTQVADPASTLTTKGYVDSVAISSHSALSDLANDDHTQYMRVDGLRVFDTTTYFPGVSNNGSVPDDTPTEPWDLATKEYVDDGVATLGSLELFEYVDIFGRHQMLNNQSMTVRYEQSPFMSTGGDELVSRDYVDDFTRTAVISDTDEMYGYIIDKLEFSDTPTTTLIDSGTDTGIQIDTTNDRLFSVSWAEIANGGTGFFVYDFQNVGYPQTFLDVTNGGIFDSTGTSGTDLTETLIVPTSDSGTDVDVRVFGVIGDVEYMEIVDGGTGLTGGDGTYSFAVGGDGYQSATWEATVTSGVIVSVARDTTAANAGVGAGYSSAQDVTTIPGITGTFTLRPYVLGAITKFEVVTLGTGYTSASYNITGVGVAGFTVSGTGTSGGTDVGTLDVTFYNPINQKLKISQYNPTVSAGDASWTDYTASASNGYTRQTGNVISTIRFDEWGHITEIVETGLGGIAWTHHKFSVDGATLNAVSNNNYWIHPDTGAVTVNLPAAPVSGTTITIDDYRGNSATNNITVSPDASDYMEGVLADDVVIDVNETRIEFTFLTDTDDTTFGWRYRIH